MGNHHGNNGEIRVGDDRIASVKSFNFTTEAPVSDATAIGDAWEKHNSGAPKKWGGSLDGYYDTLDPGQAALKVGDRVTLNLHAAKNEQGQPYHSGEATITKIDVSAAFKENVGFKVDFTGSGPLDTQVV